MDFREKPRNNHWNDRDEFAKKASTRDFVYNVNISTCTSKRSIS